MPLVEVTIGAGRTPDQVRSMIHEVHQAVLRTVNARPEHIRVVVREVPRTHWATGDVTLSEMDDAGKDHRTDVRRPAGNRTGEEEQS